MTMVDRSLGFLFPGQGSQAVGMLGELAADHAEVRNTFAEASEALGYDLWQVVAEGPKERLDATEVTQPAMLAAGVAAFRGWCGRSPVRPAWMAGHSLGEYTALVCAGAIGFADGIRLVQERGRLMQSAVPAGVGAMAALLGLEDDRVIALCGAVSTPEEPVSAANFNSPGQVVIAGAAAAVQRALDLAKQEGAKRAVLLPVSVPSHCILMAPAAAAFKPILAGVAVAEPQSPVIHNVDAAAHPEPQQIRDALERQLCGCVRWTDSVRHMAGQGVDRFVECGPGKVLLGLNKRIVADGRAEAIFNPESLEKALGLVE
jgi:[acyl-carrier-protein] S-malonyltransferase